MILSVLIISSNKCEAYLYDEHMCISPHCHMKHFVNNSYFGLYNKNESLRHNLNAKGWKNILVELSYPL